MKISYCAELARSDGRITTLYRFREDDFAFEEYTNGEWKETTDAYDAFNGEITTHTVSEKEAEEYIERVKSKG